jgi:hypothetical protein
MKPFKNSRMPWGGDMLPAMDESLDINFKPFSLRHRRLYQDWPLERPPEQVRWRLWNSLKALSEGYDITTETGWVHHSTDIEQAEALYARLAGLPDDSQAADFGNMLILGETQACFDALECFCAWVHHISDRLPRTQRLINETLRDFGLPWRMSEGLIFQVDNDFLEDEVLAEVTPLLGLVEFEGAKEEFTKARDHLTEGNVRDAIFYAHASVESTYKAALGGSSKVGIELAQAYANAGLLRGLPKEIGQSVQKALMPTAILRNQLGGHGHGEKVLDVPHEYGELAAGLAAVINTFVSRQHLTRVEDRTPRGLTSGQPKSLPEPDFFDDSDIPF